MSNPLTLHILNNNLFNTEKDFLTGERFDTGEKLPELRRGDEVIGYIDPSHLWQESLSGEYMAGLLRKRAEDIRAWASELDALADELAATPPAVLFNIPKE